MNIGLLSRGLTLLTAAGLILVGCGGSGPSNAGTGGGVGPAVVATAPVNGATSVPRIRRITATFRSAMDPSTITPATFTAMTQAGGLTGSVTLDGNTATLLLNNPVPAHTTVFANLSKKVRDTAGHPLDQDYGWNFTTGDAVDTTAPQVSSTDPAEGATGVALNKTVTVVFSEPIEASSINTSTLKLDHSGTSVPATVKLLNDVAVLDPASDLLPNTTYTATVTTGVADLSDNHLQANKTWTFKTGANKDTTAPRVVSTDPTAGQTSVSTNKKISVTFSDEMDASTLHPSTFFVKKPNSTLVQGTVSYANKVAIFQPSSALAPNLTYTVTLTTGIKDSAGNKLESPTVFSFTTAGSGDNTAPTVTSTNPADNSTNAFLNKSINATFSEAMKATSLTTATFKVDGVAGTVTYDSGSHIASFKPSVDLLQNTTYTAHVTTGAMDSSGNGLATDKTWSFTTGVQRAQTQIDLGAATSYAILAGSTVTNAGPTVVNGDLGVSPGTAVTGFPPGIVNGAMHKGDAQAAQAKSDLLNAQLDAAGRLGGATLPGDLSGLTFTPGLYKNSSTVMLSSGNVTLDAQGDPNAVFIFQMGTTLTTSTGTQVILAGGAKASNVYWSVGSSATLGVNSIFKGNILAEVSITVNTGAVHDGTLLTNVGAVTLASNTVSRGARTR